MSLPAVRSALETALSGMSPALATAWQNLDFEPVTDIAYQRAFLLAADPDEPEIGRGDQYIEQGFMQVDLAYPLGNGPGDAEARAELIRTTFYRGASFVAGGVTTMVERTPSIDPAVVEEGRFVVRVRIRFHAFVPRS